MEVLAYLQGGPAAPGGVGAGVPRTDQLQRHFLVARCIDDVHADIHPRYRPRSPPPPLKAVRDHYVGTGRYSRRAQGLVLPRGLSPFARPLPIGMPRGLFQSRRPG